MAPLVATALLASLQGYVFREADGGPPRRPLTVELMQGGRAVHRETTEANGRFEFGKVREGTYTLRARFNDVPVTEEAVTILSPGPNFAAVMLPKRRAGAAQPFGTVSASQLAARSDRDYRKKLRDAARLARNGDLAGAARLYERALEKHASAEVWDAAALLYLRLGRREDALRALERAISLDSGYLFPYAHLAMVYLDERRYRELLDLAHRALLADPAWLTAHMYLAEAQAGLGEPEAAERAARKASSLVRGRAPGPYLFLARLAWERRDCSGARRHLERYLELNTSARAIPEVRRSEAMVAACAALAAP